MEMEKILLWIDDSIELIMEVIQGVIVDSWKLDNEGAEGMRTKILIFGDACMERESTALWTAADEKNMNIDMHELFIEQCEEVVGAEVGNELAVEKHHLVENAVQIVFKKEDAGEKLTFYRELQDIWKEKNLDEANKEDYENAKECVTKLIEWMKIDDIVEQKEKSMIGIDLELLFGDLEKARENKRIISMELYHQLREQMYPCFMYSSNADDMKLVDAWKKTYKDLYEDDEEIAIYERSDFGRKKREDMIMRINQEVKPFKQFIKNQTHNTVEKCDVEFSQK